MVRAAPFADRLIAWQRRHGRRGLPWQGTRDPYRVWLSEVMLQQTQVAAVIPYYERFLKKYPTVKALAAATEEEVLRLWSGLGYYARGRNLHLAARKIVLELKGQFPKSAEQVAELPGVGRSTAAAIAAFAFGERAAILDGNVRRVLARHFGIVQQKDFWPKAESLLPGRAIEAYTQGLMDLGATVCTRAKPRCDACPVRRTCFALKRGLTAKLPAPRPKKALPSRRATWFILRHGGEVLLERRPSTGLWGGLWVFPEEASGYAIRARRNLAPIEHGFTHFRLSIRPVLCEVDRLPRAESPGRIWLEIGEAASAATPAPVKALLSSLAGR